MWTILGNYSAVGPAADVSVGFVTVPSVLFSTFRVRVVSFSVPPFVPVFLAVKLRWGFTDADALVATQGIDFAAQVDPWTAAEYASQNVRPGPVFRAILSGNPLLILPPRVAIIVLIAGTAARTSFVFELAHAALDVESAVQVAGAGGSKPRTAPPAPDTAPRWFSPFRRRLRARLRRRLLPRR